MTLSRWGGGSIQQAILRQEWQKVLPEGEEVAGGGLLPPGWFRRRMGRCGFEAGWGRGEPASGVSSNLEVGDLPRSSFRSQLRSFGWTDTG